MGVYTHINRDYKDVDGREVESYGQGCVYINRQINGIWKLKTVVRNMEQTRNTKHAACETQIDSQVEKKAYTHDTNSYKQAKR